ncbi:MAG: stage III sporulation protein AA [Syntrophomonadaceae bacterium]|nr:stage III sporulation protein AA [Syntrophomonadaceae bacterium]
MGFESQRLIIDAIIPYLSPPVGRIIRTVEPQQLKRLEEIRLRNGQPLFLKIGEQELAVNKQGELVKDLRHAYIVQGEDIYRTILAISDNSLYAFEEEIRRGFITIPGGHRVGLAGQAVMESGQIKTIKDFSSVSLRIARQVKGCSEPLLEHIYRQQRCPASTLFLSAPRCGKTTILRDLTRNIAEGSRWGPPCTVSVIDERSELGGTYRGQVQMDLGCRTDVLDGCPKAQGMMMAIRALGPQVIVTDEIGRREDVEALQECINAGVAVITSLHARDLEEAQRRPLIRELLSMGVFQTLITLSRRQGPGTVEEIVRWD